MRPEAKSWSVSIDSERPLIVEDVGVPPRTYNMAVLEAVESDPNRIQYVTADGEEVSLGQFYGTTRAVAKSLIFLGVERYEGVGILGFNSVEWFAADVGAVLAGVVAAGIYTTNKPEIVAYILNDSKSRVLFVDDEAALQKGLSCKERCDTLEAIVVWGRVDLSNYSDNGAYLYTWDEFLALGKDVSDSILDERIRAPKPENVAKLIYTSGTTGPPKAVMISHDNLTFTVAMLKEILEAGPGDHLVSYLPTSHIAGNVVDITAAIVLGPCVTLARPDALKGSLLETMKKVRPTIFIAVPRVYEKIEEKLVQVGAEAGPIKRAISRWAKGVGTQAALARDVGDDLMPWGYELANFLVFSNVRKALGLDRCRALFNAAAPMQKKTAEYFRSLNLRVLDIYGMSEATGPLTSSFPQYRYGTSGKPCLGLDVKLTNKDATGEGELCFRGRNIFVGYMNNEEETVKAIDDDGFIHTGDLGRIDEEGFISITGRAKELIVTAGGENVAPALTEGALITELPAISRAFAVGDQKKFISCLLVPYMAEDGSLVGPALEVNRDVKTAAEAAEDPVWHNYIQEGIKRANMDAISNAAKVRKHTLLTTDFSVDKEELTPSLKVKRKIVIQNHQEEIEAMYR